jgi:MOSC domain-containing protein YiiM
MTDPTIHPTAARGFDVGADAYERGRPTYPPEAVDELVARLGLRPGRTLLELGAGTGKMTRLLTPSGARVLAVEPVVGMRAKLTAAAPDVEVLPGTAEAIPLPEASVDAVVVAQAFHWFDAIRALSEIHRVLRPGGRLALAWNFRDESVPWVGELGEILHRHAGTRPQAWDTAWREALARCGLFDTFESVTFRHVQQLTPAGVLDRAASVSYIAALDASEQAAVLADVEALLQRDPETAGRDIVDLPYTTEIMWAARRSPVAGAVGLVASVNLNGGGVPKPPVDGTRILRPGLEGDGHTKPEPIHGGPDAAVCLYAQEAIERVREDGHQAFPGAFGENLTLLGIDWATLRPGDRLEVGDADDGAILELVDDATPCDSLAPWFSGGRIARIGYRLHPEDARWYARVVREGPVAPSMPVRVVPTR